MWFIFKGVYLKLNIPSVHSSLCTSASAEACNNYPKVSRELSEIAYYNLIKMSIPILIPNTPYINNTNASYVEQALTGFLLGDGVLVKKYKNEGTYFKFAQSEIHLDYLKLVFNLFKNLGIVLMETPSPGKSNIKGKSYNWYQFSTQSLKFWNDLHALWYINGTKSVPRNIFELLTPVSLAFWICDDGGKNKSGFHFATNAFSLEEVELLASVLQNKFGLKCSIHSRNRIYIWNQSLPLLSNIVKPLIPSSMYYKIDFK